MSVIHNKQQIQENPSEPIGMKTSTKVVSIALLVTGVALATLASLASFGVVPALGLSATVLYGIIVGGGVLTGTVALAILLRNTTPPTIKFPPLEENKKKECIQNLLKEAGASDVDVDTALQKFFDEYVKKLCPGHHIENVSDMIAHGANFIQTIRENTLEQIYTDNPRSVMAPFVWALMFMAHQTGQSFDRGMFVFEDPDHKISNFFEKAGSTRGSSHFHGMKQNSYGIDITQNPETGLPAKHGTAHFGRLKIKERQYSFLKPEIHGTESISQKLGHFYAYVRTRIYNPVKETHRKEHTPKSIVETFQTLFKKLKGTPNEWENVRLYGIAEMIRFLVKKTETNSNDRDSKRLVAASQEAKEINTLLIDFLSDLKNQFPMDTLLSRKGSEAVILNENTRTSNLKAYANLVDSLYHPEPFQEGTTAKEFYNRVSSEDKAQRNNALDVMFKMANFFDPQRKREFISNLNKCFGNVNIYDKYLSGSKIEKNKLKKALEEIKEIVRSRSDNQQKLITNKLEENVLSRIITSVLKEQKMEDIPYLENSWWIDKRKFISHFKNDNFLFLGPKGGGANGAGPLGGMYGYLYKKPNDTFGVQITLIKRPTEKNGDDNMRELIAESMASAFMQAAGGGNNIGTATLISHKKDDSETKEYIAAPFLDNFQEITKLTGAPRPKVFSDNSLRTHDTFRNIWNGDKDVLHKTPFQRGLAKTLALSILIGNYQYHNENLGIAQVGEGGKGDPIHEFAMIDFGGAFRRDFKNQFFGLKSKETGKEFSSAADPFDGTKRKYGKTYIDSIPEDILTSKEFQTEFRETLNNANIDQALDAGLGVIFNSTLTASDIYSNFVTEVGLTLGDSISQDKGLLREELKKFLTRKLTDRKTSLLANQRLCGSC